MTKNGYFTPDHAYEQVSQILLRISFICCMTHGSTLYSHYSHIPLFFFHKYLKITLIYSVPCNQKMLKFAAEIDCILLALVIISHVIHISKFTAQISTSKEFAMLSECTCSKSDECI